MGEVSKRNADSFIQNSVSSPKKYSGHFRNDYACIWSSWNPLVSFLFWYNWWNGDSFHWSKVSINLLWTEILLGLGDSLVVYGYTIPVGGLFWSIKARPSPSLRMKLLINRIMDFNKAVVTTWDMQTYRRVSKFKVLIRAIHERYPVSLKPF